MLKRAFCLLLLVVMSLCLCACAAKTQSLPAAVTDLPPNGIIEAAVLETLQREKQTVCFCGESAGVTYRWTVDGAQIEIPRDCNFSIRVLEANKSRIMLQFENEAGFDFLPALTLSLPFSLPAQVAAVYRGGVAEDHYICAASASPETPSLLEIPTPPTTGNCVIVPVMPQPAAAVDTAEPLVSAMAQEAEEPQTEPPSTAAPPSETTTEAAPWYDPLLQFLPWLTTAAQPTEANPALSEADSLPATAQAQTCSLSVDCADAFASAEPETGKWDSLPENGALLPPTTVELRPDDTALSVLQRVCRAQGVALETVYDPVQDCVRVEGIGPLRDADCGPQSGWILLVNGKAPDCGADGCLLQAGDMVEYRYVCERGAE